MSSDHEVPSMGIGGISTVQFGTVLAAVIAVVFHQVLLGQDSFFYRDFGLFGYPLAHYNRECFWQGEVPLWNPYSNAGLPYFAQWNTQVFYPLSLIYLLLPLPWSLNVFCLAHLWMAGLTMFLLARHWTRNSWAGALAGIGYSFCGLLQNALMWPNNIAALAWMPLVVLAVDYGLKSGGRRLGWAILAAAAQFLAGAPEVFLFTWLAIGVLWVSERVRSWRRSNTDHVPWRTNLARLFTVGIGLILVTSVQWIPLAELLIQSHRDSGFSTDEWSMPIWGLANYLVPLFHCTPSLAGVYSQDSQQWTSSYYMGIGILWLALGGGICLRKQPRVAILSVLSVFSVFMAFGQGTWVYSFLKGMFPVLGFIRYPVKYLILATWCLPLLAAFATAAMTREPKPKFKPMGTIGLALAGSTLLLLIVGRYYPVSDEDLSMTWNSGLSRVGLLVGMILTAAYLVRHGQFGPRRIAWCLGAALIALDGLTHTPNPNPTVTARAMKSSHSKDAPELSLGDGRAMISPGMHAFLSHAGNPDAEAVVAGHRSAAYPNWNLVSRTPMINGFFSLYLKRSQGVWDLLYRNQSEPKTNLLDFLGVRSMTSDEVLFAWNERTTAQPLVTIGVNPVVVGDSRALQMLNSEMFDPRHEVLLSEDWDGIDRIREDPTARILATEWKSHSLKIDYMADKRTLVVVAQTFSPNWSYEVEGEVKSVLQANYGFQALEVPAGRHTVYLRYQDQGFRIGAILSLFSLGLVSFQMIRYRGD